MSKTPYDGGFGQGGTWSELLAELLENNKIVAEKIDEISAIFEPQYKRLKANGCKEEDIRQIFLSVSDWAYELLIACADATIEIINEYDLEIYCRMKLTTDSTARQDEYLRMLKAEHSTVSGCHLGSESDSPD